MIGGEGPILNKWVCFENYTYMQAAQKYHAKVIQLEHRYFFKVPFPINYTMFI